MLKFVLGGTAAATLPLIAMAIFAIFWQSSLKAEAKPLHLAVAATECPVCEELPVVDPTDIPEYEISRERMVREVVALWDAFFDLDNASENDFRRDTFELYAEYLADMVITFQNKPTDIGGQLPKHPHTHLLLATMVTLESSVTTDVVGGKREGGLLQVHGKAQAGIDLAEIRRRPRLGIFLGVRWLAAQIPKCHPEGVKDGDWTDEHWLGPLSLYAAGPRGYRKDGTCKRLGVSKKRIAKTRMYAALVSNEIDD